MAQWPHSAWGAKEGAPAHITAITETPDGYLWLGSFDGLFRFDGVSFERYQPLTGPKLPEGKVLSLSLLPNGDLWIGYFSGNISLLRNGQATNYTVGDQASELRIYSVAQDAVRMIWAATRQGLFRLDGNQWKKAKKEWNVPAGAARSLLLDRNGTLWLATENGVFSLPRGAHSFQPASIRTNKASRIVEAPDGKLWVAEAGRSVHPLSFDAQPSHENQAEIQRTEIGVGSIQFLFDDTSALWIATLGDGLVRVPAPERVKGIIDRKNSAIESFTAKAGLSDDYATSIFRDREGSIWVGTSGGLDCFRRTTIVPLPSPTERHDADLQAAGGEDIWIVGPEGVELVHDSRFTPVAYPGGPIIAAYRDPKGANWWLSYDALVRHENGHFSKFPIPKQFAIPFGFPNFAAANITGDQSGVLWMVAQGKGLFRFENGQWSRFDTPGEFAKLTPRAAFTDDLGRVWVGYEGGTILYLDHGKITVVSTNRDAVIVRPRVIRGANRQVWIGGLTGLAFFDGQRVREAIPFDAADFGDVSDIEETSDGSLWLRDERGVLQLNPDELHHLMDSPDYRVRYEVFDSLDGLPGTFRGTGDKETLDDSGRLWFWATKGLAWLDPKSISRDTHAPTAAIRSLAADGRSYAAGPGLTLPSGTTNLQIEYAAVNLSTPERLRYCYQLEGVDKTWQDAGSRRVAFYTNLGPGKHQFHLAARNEGGEWSHVALQFVIAPAWFQTTWFRAFCACLLLILLWAIYQLRLRQLRREFSVALEARVDERTRIARDLHDTLLQSFNALLLRFQAASNLLPARPDEAKLRIESAIEQASEAITEGRDTVHELRSGGLMVVNLAESITNFTRELLSHPSSEHQPELSIRVEGVPRELNPIVGDEAYRIAAEALRNAIRHARAHRIEVELRYDQEQLRLRIRDDGKGINEDVLDQEHAPGHWGLQGMRERAKLIGGSFEVWSQLDSGTEIELKIPAASAYARSLASRGSILSQISRS